MRSAALAVAACLCVAATVCVIVVAVSVVRLMLADSGAENRLVGIAAIRPWGIAFWVCGVSAMVILWFVRDGENGGGKP